MLEEIRNLVIGKIDLSRDLSDDELDLLIMQTISEYTGDKYLSLNERLQLHKELRHSIRGLDILEDLLEDDDITEIMINGYDNIFIEKEGCIFKYDKCFSSKERLFNVIQQIVAGVNRRVNSAEPIADARLSDGSRVNIVLDPISIGGDVVTIRKFPKEVMTMEKLIELNSISYECAEFLNMLVRAKYNIFISGGTGSGKTTFLNVLSNAIPADERIITIEDSAELQITSLKNLVRLETRQATQDLKNPVSLRTLIKSSLRMRPDRIVVGEVRGPETIDMLQAMSSGHDGSISTGHANSPADMINRLSVMILMGMDIPMPAILGMIASGIDIIVQLGRLRDKSRKVLKVTELLKGNDGNIVFNDLFAFVEKYTDSKGKIIGETKKINPLKNTTKLAAAGINIIN